MAALDSAAAVIVWKSELSCIDEKAFCTLVSSSALSKIRFTVPVNPSCFNISSTIKQPSRSGSPKWYTVVAALICFCKCLYNALVVALVHFFNSSG